MLKTNNLLLLMLFAMSFFFVQCKSDSSADDSDDGTSDGDADGDTDGDADGDADEDSDTSNASDDDSDSNQNGDDTESDEPGTDSSATEDDSETEELQLVLLIDDFEDGDHMSLLGGFWYTYTDVDNGGGSELVIARNDDDEIVMDGEGYESEAALSLSYTFDQGEYEWDPYVGWGLSRGDETSPLDVQQYGGISYVYKGDAHFVMIETLNVEDYDYYKVAVDASVDWRRIEIPFSHFAQEGWGEVVDFDLTNVGNIAFQAKGATGETGAIIIDDLGFLGSEILEAEKDLEILDPDVPEKETIADLTIPNPLQALAMTVLDKGANITNWLEEGIFETYEYDERYVHNLAANGYKALRLPIDLDLYIEDRDDVLDGTAEFAVAPVLFDILDNFEAWTASAGMSLTIDFHQYDESFDIEDPLYVDAVVQLWKAVAQHFAPNTREDIFFELVNEPELAAGVNQVDQDDFTVFAQQLIDGIREVNTTHVILFGDVSWNSRNMLTHREPFADDRIVYLFHFYEPFAFTHQGASWSGLGTTRHLPWPYAADRWSEYSMDFGYVPTMENWHFNNLKNYYKQANINWLYNELIGVKQWAIDKNVPVICNEFGVYERSALKEDVVQYYTDIISVFEELEIPWQVWFMLMDAETGEMDPEIQAALGLEADTASIIPDTGEDTDTNSDTDTDTDSDTAVDTDADTSADTDSATETETEGTDTAEDTDSGTGTD